MDYFAVIVIVSAVALVLIIQQEGNIPASPRTFFIIRELENNLTK